MPAERDIRDLVGRGWAFPVDVDATGRVRWSVPLETTPTTDELVAAVSGKIRHLVLTIAGQRVLRRGYGTRLSASLLSLANEAAVASVLREVVLGLRRWENSVDVLGANAKIEPVDGLVWYRIKWRLRRVGLAGTTSVPVGVMSREADV